MSIILYHNYSAGNVINKRLSSISTYTNYQYKGDEVSMTDPIIILGTNGIVKANYLRITDFNNRYYFITNQKILTRNLLQLECHVDVLKNIGGKIGYLGATSIGYVEKADQQYGLGLINAGQNLPMRDKIDLYGYVLNDPDFVPDGGSFIMTVAGGK